MLLCCCVVVLLFCCVFVSDVKLLELLKKTTSANTLANDASLIKNEGEGIEDNNSHRLFHKPCRLVHSIYTYNNGRKGSDGGRR